MLWWTQVPVGTADSDFTLFESRFCPFSFSSSRHQPGAALNPAGLAWLLSRSLPPWGIPAGRVGWSKDAAGRDGFNVRCSKSKTPAHALFSNDDTVLLPWAVMFQQWSWKKWRITNWKCMWTIWRSCCLLDRALLLSQQLNYMLYVYVKMILFVYLSLHKVVKEVENLKSVRSRWAQPLLCSHHYSQTGQDICLRLIQCLAPCVSEGGLSGEISQDLVIS